GKSASARGLLTALLLYGNCIYNIMFIHRFICRFILEPRSLMVNEQEKKLNDSETAISSMQVCLRMTLVLLCRNLKGKMDPHSHWFL
uniref:Uncharacterized protein n=1 Tax=Aegilops tauschii subsp. strangulata TaxID=200361 RepID=A0A453BLX8_AEGTS